MPYRVISFFADLVVGLVEEVSFALLPRIIGRWRKGVYTSGTVRPSFRRAGSGPAPDEEGGKAPGGERPARSRSPGAGGAGRG